MDYHSHNAIHLLRVIISSYKISNSMTVQPLIESGMIANPNYKFCFVLDKTSMFTITSTLLKRKNTSNAVATALLSLSKKNSNNNSNSLTHHVKPLQIIWSEFQNRWDEHNTVHIDDLSRNFALSLQNGLKIKAYYRKKASSGRNDNELLSLSNYLIQLAHCQQPFNTINFTIWSDVVAGRRPLVPPPATTTTMTTPQSKNSDDDPDNTSDNENSTKNGNVTNNSKR
jgi:NLI interacting factor-like phosphatase